MNDEPEVVEAESLGHSEFLAGDFNDLVGTEATMVVENTRALPLHIELALDNVSPEALRLLTGQPIGWRPPKTEEIPPQVLAANATSVVYDPEAVTQGKRARICGHTVFITINRGTEFCCENCRKDLESLPDKTRARLRKALAGKGRASVPLAFDRALGRTKKG